MKVKENEKKNHKKLCVCAVKRKEKKSNFPTPGTIYILIFGGS